jgi:acyl-CoA thioesterase-1
LRRIFLALLLAAACAAPNAGALADPPHVQIVALGDSNIRGKGVAPDDAYPAQLERALRAHGHDVTIANEGVNGDTTFGVLARLDSAVPAGTQIVILVVGRNDVVKHGQSEETVAANKQEIARQIRAKGAEVYVIEKMQEGLRDRYDLHVEAAPTPGRTEWHLNAAGYALAVQRTLPAIEAIVKRIERRAR